MDINKLNDRITHLEEQNKALIDYINTTILKRVNLTFAMTSHGAHTPENLTGAIPVGWGKSDTCPGKTHEQHSHYYMLGLNKCGGDGAYPSRSITQILPNFEPPLEMPPLPPTPPPRRKPPPLPIAAEVIPILTIPSAPPLPLRKKVSC